MCLCSEIQMRIFLKKLNSFGEQGHLEIDNKNSILCATQYLHYSHLTKTQTGHFNEEK